MVGLSCKLLVPLEDLVVVVPRLALTMPKLHDTNAALDELSSDEHLPTLNTGPIHVEDMLGLLRYVENIHRLFLHAISKFHRLDSGLEHRIVGSGAAMLGVHPLDDVQLATLRWPR